MKALTICQPFAEMIVRGEKRVENRTWPTRYRGALYIHAGKGRAWWDAERDPERFPNAAWGAVVAIATLADCLHIDGVLAGEHDATYPWIKSHAHSMGPWCWVIKGVSAIGPWPWKGALGLFDIDVDELGRVANQILGIAS